MCKYLYEQNDLTTDINWTKFPELLILFFMMVWDKKKLPLLTWLHNIFNLNLLWKYYKRFSKPYKISLT